MNSPGKIITLDAGSADIERHRIVAVGTQDYEVVQASGSAGLIGITTETGAPAGGRADVILDGVATVEYGGTVARGAFLTSGPDGRAVTAIDGNEIIGRALIAGVAGDLGSAIISHGQLPESA